MRKIIALNHVTLDGIIQSGGGPEEDPSRRLHARGLDRALQIGGGRRGCGRAHGP